jgi:hypothetical protein
MAWDTDLMTHIPREDYEFKHWHWSERILQIFRDSVNGRWAPDVCGSNVNVMKMEADLQRRMTRKFGGILKKAGDSFSVEVLAEADAWDELFRRAEEKYPFLFKKG